MTADHPRLPLRDYFAGIAEFTFETRLGVADPPLVDYLADMLTRFIRFDALYGVRDPAGRRLGQLGAMLAEAEARVGDARRQVHRHIGDFTLFWTGVYPEALRSAESGLGDRFVDYCTQGKRAYYIASMIPVAEPQADVKPEVLERLSEEFELCAFGLGEARKEWERRDDDGPWRLLVFN